MKTICLILITLAMQNLSAQDKEITTIYLIRHAEKADNSSNPELSQAGIERAINWAKYFEKTPIDAFYTTLYRRTQQTCATIATTKQKEINFYKPQDLDLKKLISENKGKTILIVGHSNTIPKHINQLLGQEKYSDIPESDFGNLYIVKAKNNEITSELIIP